MRVAISDNRNEISLSFQIEEDDVEKPTEKYQMGDNGCTFILPGGFTREEIHPDHLALVIIMLCSPFCKGRLKLPGGVSERFFEATKVFSRFDVEPTDFTVEPYEPPDVSKPALAFSGGVDSTAALALMPESTICVFLDRPIKGKTLYDKDAQYHICEELGRAGKSVYMIESDLEYLRNPVGFPVDVANSAPAVLIAQQMGFNSIAFGTILESAYGIGHKRYREYPLGRHFRTWGGLFQGAGIPLNLVVAGISEVGTSKINVSHHYGSFSQSCIRGKRGSPCKNCWKCFRKILLDKILRGEEIEDSLLDELFAIREAQFFLSDFPIKHENILTWITSRYFGKHEQMLKLKRRVRGDSLPLEWLEYWNPESSKLIHESCRESVITKINRNIGIMNENMVKEMKEWDMQEMLDSESYSAMHENLVETFK